MQIKSIRIIKSFIALVLIINTSLTMPLYANNPVNDILIQFKNGIVDHGTRCGTPDLALPVEIQIPDDIELWLKQNKAATQQLVLPIVFHVIQDDNSKDNVTDAQLNKQLNVLNKTYTSTGIQFNLKKINRIKNSFYYNISPGFRELLMKMSLNESPNNTINVYITKTNNNLLGWSTLPWSYEQSFFMHGIVILNATLPDGAAQGYNQGHTLVHELGHYLGLYHTFQNGCMIPGDEVADTAYHAEANYGCPVGSNTCGGSEVDPINNFMNYTDDTCMDNFTPLQSDRMRWAIQTFKSSLLKDRITNNYD